MSNVDHHTDTDASTHEQAKRALAERLANHHRGRENAVSSRELAESVPVSASTVRDLIAEIRREFNLPIGSSNGYFVIDDADELARQIDRQKRQAETSMQTAEDMAAAWNRNRRGR